MMSPAFNPMLLHAQLQAMAQQHHHHPTSAGVGHQPSLLSSYTASMLAERMKQQQHRFAPYTTANSSVNTTNSIASNGHTNNNTSLNTSIGSASSSLGSPGGGSLSSHGAPGAPPTLASAFRSLTPRSTVDDSSSPPPVSPPHCTTSATPPLLSPCSPSQSPVSSGGVASVAPPPTTSCNSPPKSDIRNIERMINGLHGGAGPADSGSRFSLAHPAASQHQAHTRLS